MRQAMFILGGASALALVGAAEAGFTYNGAGGSIPDNNPAGLVSDIVVNDSFAIADITITLGELFHTWAGDLIVTVTHVESNSTQTLFHRIGSTTGTGVGDSSNFGGDYSFNDAFTGDLWQAAVDAGGSAGTIASGNYFASGAGSASQVSLLSVFGGLNAQGTWRLTITDNAGADLGTLGGWSLALTAVPAPGALALLGLGALAGGRRRR